MISADSPGPRPGLTRLPVVFLCLCALSTPALGEDSGGSPSRLLQMFGLNGKKDDPPDSEPASGSGEGRSRVLQMLGLTRGSGRSADPKARRITDCPEIVVDGAGAELRSPPGADAASVRYQLSIGRTARECALTGDEITVKVGVEGAAMLGPAGQSGAYSGNLRIALRRKSDDQLFSEKTHRVGATIPAGAARAEFSLLVDDLSAPFISSRAAEDYEVVVSFVQGGEGVARPSRHSRNGG